MWIALPPPRPRRPFPAWVLVALLHAVVAVALWRLPVWADRAGQTAEQAPLVVRLFLSTARPTSPEAEPQPRAAKRPAPPEAITLPVPDTVPSIGAAAVEPDAAPAPSPAPGLAPGAGTQPSPLNLALPRGASAPWRQRNPALDDPRSNTARLTLEQKLALAMGGDGTWAEERLDLDHIRYRRGNECILATRSRAGQLELGGGAFRDTWQVRNC